jgi:Leucine-rich repeat (LRR) protein
MYCEHFYPFHIAENVSGNFINFQLVGLNLASVPSSLPSSTIHLDLSSNRIHILRNRSFEYLVSLITLDLSDNKISNITPEAFKGLT